MESTEKISFHDEAEVGQVSSLPKLNTKELVSAKPPRSPQHRRGLERLNTKTVNAIKTSERCPDCGIEIKYPNLQVRYVYQSCPHCEFQLKPATTLSIPPPHKSIMDKNVDNRCFARVFNHGQGGRCSRIRIPKSEFCRSHDKANKGTKGLPYGRIDAIYDKPHPMPEFDKHTAAQEMSLSLLPNPSATASNKKRVKIKLRRKENGSEEKNESTDDESEGDDGSLEEMKNTHDAIVLAKKRALESQKVDDSVILSHASKLVHRKLEKSKITTELMCQHLEPTFGVDIRSDPEKIDWIRSNVEALLSVPSTPLSILAAALGHPREATKAINIEEELNKIIKKHGGTRLHLGTEVDLLSLCGGVDPCPGEDKVLRVRYNMYGHRGEVAFSIAHDNLYLSAPLDIHLFAKRPRLNLIRALFGHPNDITKTFNVTEQVQGMADLSGEGEILTIGVDENNLVNFRDPCIGVVKTLKIKYETMSERHDRVFYEANDHLLQPVSILAPVVSPLLTVISATLTSVSFNPRKSRLIKTEVVGGSSRNIHRASSRRKNEFLDVTEQMQELVDQLGGDMLRIQKNECLSSVLGLSSTFLRNRAKKLHVDYVSHGKQSNFILDVNSNDLTQRDIFIDARPILPTIIIHGAVYGHPTDPKFRFNVQETLDVRVRQNAGRVLQIGTNESLSKLFGGDPCYPAHVNKVLLIKYEIRKLSGEIGATVHQDGFLRQAIRIGWPRNLLGRNLEEEDDDDDNSN